MSAVEQLEYFIVVRVKYDEQCSSATGLASALLRDLATVKTFRAAVSND